jgi:hypothetical protein
MEFCGIKPTRLTRYADVRGRTEEQLAAWIRDAADLGAADAARPGQPGRPDHPDVVRPEPAAA